MNYTTLASYYDALVSDKEATKDWVEYTKRYVKKGKVLDFGCGSGDFAIGLAKEGFVVDASDLSSEMIEVAKNKQGSKLVNWQVLNMLDLSEIEEYDAVTCYCDSLNYLQSYKELEKVIEKVYKALKVSGVFMFDIHSLDTLQEFKQESIEEGYIEDVSYQWCIYSNDQNLYYSFIFQDGEKMLLKEHHQQFVFDPIIVKAMLEKQGFEVKNSTDFTLEGITKGNKIFFSCLKR
ncbi:MAG: class I SAM-dependent methyltransferase [Erysipelotrichia bacterium]|nr:class I SAM-dependent methyltransferase [Erysipelotrichia bacterium]